MFVHYSASATSTTSKKSEKLEMLTDPSKITVDESSYKGPHVTLPLTLLTVRNIVELYKSNKVGSNTRSIFYHATLALKPCVHWSQRLSRTKLKELFFVVVSRQLLHVKYILLILRETREKLMALPNISKASTSITKQITICGEIQLGIELFMPCLTQKFAFQLVMHVNYI